MEEPQASPNATQIGPAASSRRRHSGSGLIPAPRLAAAEAGDADAFFNLLFDGGMSSAHHHHFQQAPEQSRCRSSPGTGASPSLPKKKQTHNSETAAKKTTGGQLGRLESEDVDDEEYYTPNEEIEEVMMQFGTGGAGVERGSVAFAGEVVEERRRGGSDRQ